MKGVYKRGNKWWIRYRYEGQLIRKSIGHDKKLAEEALTAIKGDIVRGEYRLRKNKDRCFFKEMVDVYFKEKEKEKEPKRSLARDRASFKKLLPEFQHKALHSITSQDVEEYQNERKKEVSNSTVNKELALLKHMFNIAIKKGYAEKNPVTGVDFLEEPPPRTDKFFEEYEIHQLVNSASPHLRPVLMTAFCTGLRGSDLLDLKWENIDFDNNLITVNMHKTSKFIRIPMMPIIKPVLENLKANADNSLYVFSYNGRKIGSVRKAFQTALKKSGLDKKDYQFRDIRRTFATMLLKNGVILTKIQLLLGHKSILTTERYLGVKLEETRQAVHTLDQSLSQAFIDEKSDTISAQLPAKVHANPLLSIN